MDDEEIPPYRKSPRKRRREKRGLAEYMFRFYAQSARNRACGSEERFWWAFKNWLDPNKHSWLTTHEWIVPYYRAGRLR